ncbi:SGNH/GDSL hydrolase family protein [Sphaerisporangium sp. TRM90804]|uniref:SGNH/GDSL hydrolase family protein n=1 Tax=Sphaerisporangium sp. TRM90804 TaxID=3031113 RepID=UPI00244BCC8B|nr:SGNH/GDSL hydrolase family protein [Sphaerisporangium sp. TRM90804]MDH2428984.1 SGNH/GDSL hydrolase family protein [Sphaerisporangium sp. TRM90804]
MRPRRIRRWVPVLGAFAALGLVASVSTAVADARRGEPLQWVVLGDSYTAGAIPAASSKPGGRLNDPPHFRDGAVGAETRSGCDQTDLSYPYRVDAALGEKGEGLVKLTANVSCGGAQIKHIQAERQTPYGQNIPGLSKPDHLFFPTDPDADATSLAFPKVERVQLDAVTGDTRLVTVGIGGNSLGFAPIIAKCMELGAATGDEGAPCSAHFTEASADVETITRRLERVAAEYRVMLDQIKAKAHPEAKILAIGYPFIIPEDDQISRCMWGRPEENLISLHHFASVTHDDLRWLRDSVLKPLNSVIAQAAADEGAHFVDLYGLGAPGHHVCGQTGVGQDEAWVEGLIDQHVYVPVITRWPRGALVHPNAKGHEQAATAVIAKIRELLT